MILVDSSVWIDFFNGRDTVGVRRLSDLLEDASAPLALADLVLFEVLRGFRDERDYLAARRALAALDVVEIGGEQSALHAAEHYRALRAGGFTVNSPVDVLQASFCIENDYALLHSDRDYDAMESLRGLKVWKH
ncbi:PIN domain-containing protein [Paucibacter sp. B2R-40]|uniref:type II toxin-antitoxin system VapC family toxin n=1 Tax=Paucibacter sp. B2R-40 TaxID=2893554 RepID=UPI0021E404D5|nr:PIN domain-containing protein [Paucibacter sp. B2R-40]MCV2356990.1 PIN domain-containing protein [Paucibacter sp. B2R-40]